MKLIHFLSVTILCCFLSCLVIAQEPPGKGAISGSATLDGKPIPGLMLALQREQGDRGSRLVGRAETDAEGKFQFNNLPAGSYGIKQLAPHLILDSKEAFGNILQKVVVAEGDALEKVNITLQRGGVVTGKILDVNGAPIIGQRVSFERVDPLGRGIPVIQGVSPSRGTDDRGIYRLFGMFPGRYRIYIGDRNLPHASSSSSTSRGVPLTFYPGTHDVTRAKIVEVVAGGEITNVDINLSAAERAFHVIGRVVDTESGAPLPNILVGYQGKDGWTTKEVRANEKGEFRYESFPPGEYFFYAFMGAESEYFSDLIRVEVKDRDIEGLIIKAHTGASVGGWVTFEGKPEPAVLAQIKELRIEPFLRSVEQLPPRDPPQRIGADGSFVLKGLRPGYYSFKLSGTGNSAEEFNLIRIEQQGVAQDRIEVVPGKNLTGVRLVIAIGTGGIRGQVKPDAESIGLPENAYLQVLARRTQNVGPTRYGVAQADRRGNFTIEGLAPGEYALLVSIRYEGQPAPRNLSVKTMMEVLTVKRGEFSQIIVPIEVVKQEQR